MYVFSKEQSMGSSTDLRVESLPGIQVKSEQKLERKSIFHNWVFLEFKIIGHRGSDREQVSGAQCVCVWNV